MRKEILLRISLFLIISLIGVEIAVSQTPNSFNYQAVVRNSNNELLMNTTVGIQLSIFDELNQSSVYVETFTQQTTDHGLLNLAIGQGNIATGDFSAINWQLGDYYLIVEIDIEGGTDYIEIGREKLLSVPYALHSKSAESITGEIPETDPVFGSSLAAGISEVDTAIWNRKQILSIEGDLLSISEGNSITLPDKVTKVPVLTNEEIAVLEATEGYAVFNKSENVYQIFNGDNWISFSSDCWPQPTEAIAGSGVLFEDTTLSYRLEANVPQAHHGVGQWTIVNGEEGTFTDINDPNALFKGLACTEYELEWSITTECGISSDYTIVMFYQSPTGAFAGDSRSFSDATVSVQLEANQPDENHGTGTWSILSGEGGEFVDINDPNTLFTGLPCTEYDLQWKIETECDSSIGNVYIVFNQAPTTALAGDDQFINDGSTSTSLTANVPEERHGEGTWTILSGEGGSFSDIHDANATFTGLGRTAYDLRWTIATDCDSTYDEVNIAFFEEGPGEGVADIDGNTYNTVWIGTQHWMAENLKVSRYNDGVVIPNLANGTQWLNDTEGAYCWYNNDSTNYEALYGKLYNGYAVETEKLCPSGWHVPTREDQEQLASHLGGYGVAGGKLKETGTTHWASPNTGATDEYGFNALPGGARTNFIMLSFDDLSTTGYFYFNDFVLEPGQFYNYSIFSLSNSSASADNTLGMMYGKDSGLSVRCIED